MQIQDSAYLELKQQGLRILARMIARKLAHDTNHGGDETHGIRENDNPENPSLNCEGSELGGSS